MVANNGNEAETSDQPWALTRPSVQAKWMKSTNLNTIMDPLNGEKFITFSEVDEIGIKWVAVKYYDAYRPLLANTQIFVSAYQITIGDEDIVAFVRRLFSNYTMAGRMPSYRVSHSQFCAKEFHMYPRREKGRVSCIPISVYLFLTCGFLDDTRDKNPEYVVTADDVHKLIAVEYIPMDEQGRQGEIVRLFANKHNKIRCGIVD
ncbi:hypothetical protein CTI12_AA297940 [Artemisia annua]|uniref:Uncharacterized protein n=1 Tax=Artemisia annua TaxID=35608 RepID=A0A2U1N7M2_ARTAN|nr:hypothetical protein CTI12_AA297940 [Artemisia annua]